MTAQSQLVEELGTTEIMILVDGCALYLSDFALNSFTKGPLQRLCNANIANINSLDANKSISGLLNISLANEEKPKHAYIY